MVAALIIAAGRTKRQDAFDPMQKVGSITAAERQIAVFQRAGIEKIALVYAPSMQKAQRLAAHRNVVCLEAAERNEMFDSIKIGLRYLCDKCDAALITPVDIPLFTVETVEALLKSGADAAVPVLNGSAGHPLLLSSKRFEAVLSYKGGGGLRGAIRAAGIERQGVPVEDEGVLADIGKQKDVSSLIARHSLKTLHVDARLRISRERAFFGPGPNQLLMLVEETGSLREACRRMGISYSKGWSVISLMEQQLGFAVIDRRQGGKAGGASYLTENAEELLKRYAAFQEAANKAVQDAFQEHFGGWAEGNSRD